MISINYRSREPRQNQKRNACVAVAGSMMPILFIPSAIFFRLNHWDIMLLLVGIVSCVIIPVFVIAYCVLHLARETYGYYAYAFSISLSAYWIISALTDLIFL